MKNILTLLLFATSLLFSGTPDWDCDGDALFDDLNVYQLLEKQQVEQIMAVSSAQEILERNLANILGSY